MKKKECIALILAGGQGSRLGSLTKNLAKPAVPFGGRYRIIDFTLSNCSNSDIDTVGVLTQYQPLVLNSYIGIGSPWNLDRNNGGVTLLPPYTDTEGRKWFRGTADAIYQNIFYVNQFDPDYVLVLSGDHIYKMDYSKMLAFHKKKGADATISVIEVSWDEASRFGIMNTERDGRIIEFEEKPKVPRSNLASMGIYIFNWKLLRDFLIEDSKNENSSHDFGKNIIPSMLKDGRRMFAYRFKGYWRDVGTIESFYEANMDLISDSSELDIYDSNWKIYSENSTQPPHYAGPDASVKCSLINEGCVVFGEVENSILFQGVYVGKNVKIKNSLIMPGARIMDNATLDRVIVGEGSIVREGVKLIGGKEHKQTENYDVSDTGIIVIGENTVI